MRLQQRPGRCQPRSIALQEHHTARASHCKSITHTPAAPRPCTGDSGRGRSRPTGEFRALVPTSGPGASHHRSITPQEHHRTGASRDRSITPQGISPASGQVRSKERSSTTKALGSCPPAQSSEIVAAREHHAAGASQDRNSRHRGMATQEHHAAGLRPRLPRGLRPPLWCHANMPCGHTHTHPL